jgi:hypothetical protein
MKVRNFFVTGVFAVALAFFLSCSDTSGPDEPGTGGSNLGDSNSENFQIYLGGLTPFDGNGIIRIGVYDDRREEYKDFIPFGTVTNGKGTLDFSVEVPNNYLTPPEGFSSSISINPKNAKAFDTMVDNGIYLISGNRAYSLQQLYQSRGKYEVVFYMYAEQATTVKGSDSEQDCDEDGCDIIDMDMDLDLKQGWNAIYISGTESSSGAKVKFSTNPNTVNMSSIKWVAVHEGSAVDYGGADLGSIDPSANYCSLYYGLYCISMEELQMERDESCEELGGTPVRSCPITRDGYCKMVGNYCFESTDMECNYRNGTFSITKPSGCREDEYEDGFCKITGNYCFESTRDECNYGFNGTFSKNRPSNCKESEAPFCVDHDYGYCVPTQFFELMGESCSDLDGVVENSCPAGYEIWP